ncbi:recombination regulator RecX [Cellulomonas sp. C5510]|nr:recombination regulator RecX [Cellulomonas sp. C5510]
MPAEHGPAADTTAAERPSARSATHPSVRPTAAELAERVAEVLARPTGDGPTSARRASGARGRSAGSRDVGGVPSDEGDADRGPGSSRSRSGAGGPRPTRGRRRAPAGEPPASGPAATDAEPDPESVARSVALRLLTGAPRSRAQLAEAMARKDVPEEVAERVLDRFTDVGLVDDSAYAEMLVRTRHAERGMSRRGIAQELRRRGVDDVTARDALAQVDDEDEERAARALARKKLSATRGLDRETRLRRAYGALGRKGYGGELVARVVREELAAEAADLDG